MKTIRFGIIGCGLMGKEFASSIARWCHLTDAPAKPEIVAICNRSTKPFNWFTENFPSIKQVTHDYRELLANPDVDAVYIALPHDKHSEVYVATIEAGKHLMGEKPFGIDAQANALINQAIAKNPKVFVRCVSQFPFYPAVQQIGKMLDENAFGQILSMDSGFLHSSDMNPDKPINWKREVAINGEYGVMGDLGMHACHVPLRAGFRPLYVRAILSNIIQTRPGPDGHRVPCETWDNATLLINTKDQNGYEFPWTLRTQRICPGEKNTWYIEILGSKSSVRFSTRDPKRLELLNYQDGQQIWQQIQTGFDTPYATITGGIFEFGFTDAMLQMWAAFIYEMVQGNTPCRFAGCVTPDEVAASHGIFTAALKSHMTNGVAQINS